MAEEEADDHINKLPDDVLVGILSLLPYKHAVQTAPVSRRWEHLLTQLPDLRFSMSALGHRNTTRGMPSEPRVQSMERTLRRRCRDDDRSRRRRTVQTLSLTFRKDVPMECRHAADFIALAGARKLLLHVQCARGLPDEDAGDWSVELPPATSELHVLPYWYAVRPPRIHGPGAGTLRSLTLQGLTVLHQRFLLTSLPSLEDLHIGKCTLPDSIAITSDAMPRLKHLDIADVSVVSRGTRAGISVLANELRTLRVSCYGYSSTESRSDPDWFLLPARFSASFTSYSCFRLRAPRLQVFEWRCCYADEVCIESVGRLLDVAVEIADGRMPRTSDEERTFVSTEQRDKLMTDILQGLVPGLKPRSWGNVKRKCVQHGDKWLCFQITSASHFPVTE
ncbi:unnamed protein product [Urochloa humidicola]